jgi:hypothetical protein
VSVITYYDISLIAILLIFFVSFVIILVNVVVIRGTKPMFIAIIQGDLYCPDRTLCNFMKDE